MCIEGKKSGGNKMKRVDGMKLSGKASYAFLLEINYLVQADFALSAAP